MEIGSEFWKNNKNLIDDADVFYLSGRTALDAIIRDAIEVYGVKRALLPSYCCHTMIEPFLRNAVSVRFYDVYANDDGKLCANIPKPQEAEMLYIIKYFGFSSITYIGEGSSLNGWDVSLEDMTHSCFIKDYQSDADYYFVSYRKWFAVDGIAVARKRNGVFLRSVSKINTKYCRLRNEAFELKNRYMTGENIEKKDYLDLFSTAENMLENDYVEYKSRRDSVGRLFLFLNQIEDVRNTRQENVKILCEGLKDLSYVSVLNFSEKKNECPLFLPILVEGNMRDKLRKYLIGNKVYCPIHWPLSEYHFGITQKAKELYDKELSLVCDQRYSTDEMHEIVKLIQKFDSVVEKDVL